MNQPRTLTEAARMMRPRRMLAQWDGEPPLPGHYLFTEKGRTAKRILEVRKYEGIQQHGGKPFDYLFIYESVPLSEVPRGAIAHGFEYFHRQRKRLTTSGSVYVS